MKKYTGDDSFDNLESWPFDYEESQYRIVRGNPQASGRIDYGMANSQQRMGVWRCTEGVFECTERGDELQTLLQGKLVLTRADGESITCSKGDSIFTHKGERVTWDIRETVIKIFFTCA